MYVYRPEKVCAKKITFEVHNDQVSNVSFVSGCSGNLQGISKLIEGMNIYEAIERLAGIECGAKTTSCPDQLKQALEQYLQETRNEQVSI
ncbi:TIGR03905 family TSCPD domain-containing protein [Natranaerobius thermophilus]|uniref:ribonucleoside-diphosphate reductase n=1 Tax=Natranaerobius thermophilus (strain ATCC BAA-1301 / DSM 18059 / JW/NM-WN-LF) TaxID=457570 RepID=B2A7E0_NATTJ|nr:TIGR03905 family TSCPD domain-containing protein [Natranaerobius thermophilus]ACB84332.1 conserved hypothetical protein [Natranaerobius thermophilus JW/NM-WN-LF]